MGWTYWRPDRWSSDWTHKQYRLRRVLQRWQPTGLRVSRQDCPSLGCDRLVQGPLSGESGPSKKHPQGTLTALFTPNDTSAAVSHDGKWIAGYTVNNLRAVRVWDSKTGRLAATFEKY